MSRCFVYHTSRLINLNKKVDFDVDFDDEKTRPRKAERSIAKKDSIKNLSVNGAKVGNYPDFFGNEYDRV